MRAIIRIVASSCLPPLGHCPGIFQISRPGRNSYGGCTCRKAHDNWEPHQPWMIKLRHPSHSNPSLVTLPLSSPVSPFLFVAIYWAILFWACYQRKGPPIRSKAFEVCHNGCVGRLIKIGGLVDMKGEQFFCFLNNIRGSFQRKLLLEQKKKDTSVPILCLQDPCPLVVHHVLWTHLRGI
jgi:hypothetical protein